LLDIIFAVPDLVEQDVPKFVAHVEASVSSVDLPLDRDAAFAMKNERHRWRRHRRHRTNHGVRAEPSRRELEC